MTSTLVIPKSIASSTVPAPSKSEIVAALAHRKLTLCQEELAKWEIQVAESEKALEAAMLEFLMAKRDDASVCRVEVFNGYENNSEAIHGAYIKFTTDNLSRELQRKVSAHKKLRKSRPTVPSFFDAKREIRASMDGLVENRVSAMLKDETTVAALDKFLSKLDSADRVQPGAVAV